MKDIIEKVKLNTEEAKMVTGGFSLGSVNLASLTTPAIAVYKQCGCTISDSLKPVAGLDLGSLTLGSVNR